MNLATISEELKRYENWIVWREEERDGKLTKAPYIPDTDRHASSTEPDTWRSFSDAVKALESGNYTGLGFVFTDTPFAGVDLDHVLDGSDLDADAAEIVEVLDSYTERSPSGDGLHVIVEGDLPERRRRQGNVEMYDSGRYFTMTGDHWPGTPQHVEERAAQLKMLHSHVFSEDGSGPQPQPRRPSRPVDLSDRELIEKAMEDRKFADLWDGRWEQYSYDSQSEADEALVCKLAFYTHGDPQHIEQLFSRSALGQRSKWDRADYRELTITNGLRFWDGECFTPGRSSSQRGDEDAAAGVEDDSDQDQDGDESVDTWPYAVEDGRIVHLKRESEEEIVSVPVADFTARITHQITTEYGERHYRLAGEAVTGGPFRAEIEAERFAETRRLVSTLDGAAGALDPVRRGMRRHLGPAVKLLSRRGEIEHWKRFERVGWEGGGYLIPGRLDEGIECKTDRCLPFECSPDADLHKGIESLEHLLGALDPTTTAPVIGFVLLPPIARAAGCTTNVSDCSPWDAPARLRLRICRRRWPATGRASWTTTRS